MRPTSIHEGVLADHSCLCELRLCMYSICSYQCDSKILPGFPDSQSPLEEGGLGGFLSYLEAFGLQFGTVKTKESQETGRRISGTHVTCWF